MCADLVPRLGVEKSYQQNKIIWEFAATFSFILVIAKHHLLVRQEKYHKFSLKSLCPLERTKVEKVKSDKKKIVCGFHFEEHHFKRESDREGRENGDQQREIRLWESVGDLQRKGKQSGREERA